MAKRLSKKLEGFSVSQATMREEDLIPAFTEFLQRAKNNGVTLSRRANATLREANALMKKHAKAFTGWNHLPVSVQDEASYLLQDLFDALDEIAPSGCYFGAHPGDGADYGFWKSDYDW
jgi:predicted phosphoadenosine phosphosulfate sulfurtransferase